MGKIPPIMDDPGEAEGVYTCCSRPVARQRRRRPDEHGRERERERERGERDRDEMTTSEREEMG